MTTRFDIAGELLGRRRNLIAVNEFHTRSFQIAETLIVLLYPTALASQQLVDQTNAWLDANPTPPPLRRLVIENLAGVERALRVQATDLS